MIIIELLIGHNKVIQTNYVILREHFTHFHVYIFHTKEGGGGIQIKWYPIYANKFLYQSIILYLLYSVLGLFRHVNQGAHQLMMANSLGVTYCRSCKGQNTAVITRCNITDTIVKFIT